MRPPNRFKKGTIMFKQSKLRKEIDNVLEQMQVLEADSPEYGRCAERLVLLTQALDNQSSASSKKFTPFAAIVGQLTVTAALVTVEKNGILTSKIPDYVNKIVTKK